MFTHYSSRNIYVQIFTKAQSCYAENLDHSIFIQKINKIKKKDNFMMLLAILRNSNMKIS